MAKKSMQELIALVNANLPTNGTGNITAVKLREVFTEFINAISPAYGFMSIDSVGVEKNITTVFQTLNYSSKYDSDIAQTTSDFGTGNIARADRGSSVLEFAATVEFAVNREIEFSIFRNGTRLPWSARVQGGGVGKPRPINISGIDYFDPAAVYSVGVRVDQDTLVLFTDVAFILKIDPVNSFI